MSQFDRLPPAGERNNLPTSNYYDVLEEVYDKENARFLEEERLKEELKLRKEAIAYQESHVNFYKSELDSAYSKIDVLDSRIRKIKASQDKVKASIKNLNADVEKLKDYIYHKEDCKYINKINCGRKLDDTDEVKDCTCGFIKAAELIKTITGFDLKEIDDY